MNKYKVFARGHSNVVEAHKYCEERGFIVDNLIICSEADMIEMKLRLNLSRVEMVKNE